MGTEGPMLTVYEQQTFIQLACDDRLSLYLIALHGHAVVGTISFSAGRQTRTSHAGEFTIAVLKDFAGIGIGRALIRRMLHWAQSNDLHRISLEVRVENTGAFALYRSFGFQIEGRLTRTVWYDGYYHDSYLMGLIIPLRSY